MRIDPSANDIDVLEGKDNPVIPYYLLSDVLKMEVVKSRDAKQATLLVMVDY